MMMEYRYDKVNKMFNCSENIFMSFKYRSAVALLSVVEFEMSSRWSRDELSCCIINSTVWLSIALGIFPYDYTGRRIVQSKCCLVYTLVVDVALAVFALHLWHEQQYLNLWRIANWSLMEVFTQFLYAVNIYGILAILWTNSWEYTYVWKVFKEFAALERSYFGKHQSLSAKCMTFHNLLTCKGLIVLMNIFFYLLIFTAMLIKARFIRTRIFVAVFSKFLNIVIILVIMHFYTHVMVTYRYIWVLKERLKHLSNFDTPHAQAQNLWREINEIVRIYMRLQQLSREFTRIYGKQVFFGIAALTAENAQNVLVLLFMLTPPAETWKIIFSAFFIAKNIVYFWLIICACELAVEAARELGQLLRCFNAMPQVDVEAERALQLLSFNCIINKPKFRVWGFVELSSSMGLEIILILVLQIIYLLQSNYTKMSLFSN
ncbi:putative gustatory receptor 22b [Ceratitis capitata]|nr:putative gustatory receptor 22b [Ceratitis capitata]